MKIEPLQTERFLVKSLTVEDVSEQYVSWFSEKTVRQYIVAARFRQTLETLRTFVAEKLASETALLLGIFSKTEGGHIGNMKFEPIDRAAGRAVVGILIGETDWRGRAVFGEVFAAAVRILAETMQVTHFWLGVEKENESAIRAYCKAGFRVEAPPHDLFPESHPDGLTMHCQILS